MADKDASKQSNDNGDVTKQENASAGDVQKSVSDGKETSSINVDPNAALETSKDNKTAQSASTADQTSPAKSGNTNAGTGQDYVAPDSDDKSKTADEKKRAASGDDTPNAAPADSEEGDDEEPPTVIELTKLVADSSSVSDTLVKSFEERLDKYITEMAPRKPISMEDAARNQVYLWDTLSLMLDLSPQAFGKVMDMTLAKIKENAKGAFGATYIRRGFERMDAALTGKRRLAFDLYLNLLTQYATLENKSRLNKFVDLPRTAEAFSDPKHQQRVLTYFGSFR